MQILSLSVDFRSTYAPTQSSKKGLKVSIGQAKVKKNRDTKVESKIFNLVGICRTKVYSQVMSTYSEILDRALTFIPETPL